MLFGRAQPQGCGGEAIILDRHSFYIELGISISPLVFHSTSLSQDARRSSVKKDQIHLESTGLN